MAFDIVGLALDFIAAYGLIAIFILLVLDGALLLPVFPGEIVLVLAVATYATDPASLVFLIAVTSLAALLGSLLLYGITRGGGRPLVERFPRFFMMPRKRRERLERVFKRPVGQSLVLFLRLFPLTRVLVAIPAGLAKMPIVRFVVLSTIGLTLYHAGFLWFAYEARRPGSEVETRATMLREAYANPAWDLVQANAIIAGAILLVVGIVISVRASRGMLKDPEESTGSLIGSLTAAILFWGGIAAAVFTYMDPETVFALIALGGIDIDRLSVAAGLAPLPLLFATAGTAIAVGLLLGQLESMAKARRRRHKVMKKYLAGRQRDAGLRAAVRGRPAPVGVGAASTPATEAPGAPQRVDFTAAGESQPTAGAAAASPVHRWPAAAPGAPADAQHPVRPPARLPNPAWESESTLRSRPTDGPDSPRDKRSVWDIEPEDAPAGRERAAAQADDDGEETT